MTHPLGKIMSRAPDGSVMEFQLMSSAVPVLWQVDAYQQNAPLWYFWHEAPPAREMIGRMPCVLRGDFQRKIQRDSRHDQLGQSENSQRVNDWSHPWSPSV